MPAATALAVKQRRFVKHYLETGNGTEAAMVAYDVADRNTARSIGTENLRQPEVFIISCLIIVGERAAASRQGVC
jgi:Terminase small subunit